MRIRWLVCLALLACDDDGGSASSTDSALPPPDAAQDSAVSDALPSDASSDDAAPEPKVVTVGTGSSAFEPIGEGETLQIEQGFQGGYHVWGAWRAPDFEGDSVEFALRLRVEDRVVAQAGWFHEFVPGEPKEMYGVSVAFTGDPEQDYTGVDARLEVQLLAAAHSFEDVRPVALDCCEMLDGVGGFNGGVLLRRVDANPRGVEAGGEVAVVVEAEAGGDPSHAWTTEAGTFADPAAAETTWTAPDLPGRYLLRVEVTFGDESVRAGVPVVVR